MQSTTTNSTHQVNNQQTFVINESLIPTYNPLTKQMSPTGGDLINFCKLFKFPELETRKIEHPNTISLKDLKNIKPKKSPVNIFNPVFPEKKQIKHKAHIISNHKYNINLQDLTCIKPNTTTKISFLTPIYTEPKTRLDTTVNQTITSIKDIKHLHINKSNNSEGILGISLGLLIFILYIRIFFKKQLNLFLRSSLNRTISNKIASERNILTIRASNYLNLFYVFTISLFILLLINYTNIYPTNISILKQYGIITLSLLVFYVIKWSLSKIISHILGINSYTNQYFSQSFIFNKSFAIVSLPILITTIYLPDLLSIIALKLIIYFALITTVFRIFRLLIICIQKKLSILYMFLYLCALEIMPIIILIKLVMYYLGVKY